MQEQYTAEQVKAATLEYFHGDELAAQVFVTKYALQNESGNYLELTPDDMHHRLAKEFARIEQKYPNAMSEEEIYELLKEFKYVVPAGSPMAGIGNNSYLSSLSNCTAIESPKDNISSILNTGKDLANLSKMRAGVGIDLSTLRPEGSAVNNSAKTSSGAWSFAELYSSISRMIGQGGRRGAIILSMDVRHPDIEKFITMKQDLTKVVGANVSVKLTDEFMKAVEADQDFVLQFPIDSREPLFTRVVKAKQLWNLIAESATKTAEPGVLFWDTICENLPAHEYEQFKTVTVNPCVAGNTDIVTNAGNKTIKELADMGAVFKALSCDVASKQIEFKDAMAFKTKESAKVIKLRCAGKELVLTPEHLVYTKRGWIAARDLTKNDEIMVNKGSF